MYRLRCKGWMSLLAVCLVWAFGLARAAGPDTVVSDRVKPLTRAMSWRQTGAIPVNFNTYHPQGMVKIGDVYYGVVGGYQDADQALCATAGRL